MTKDRDYFPSFGELGIGHDELWKQQGEANPVTSNLGLNSQNTETSGSVASEIKPDQLYVDPEKETEHY